MRFQRGACGAGLLLLRAAIGSIAILQGKAYLAGHGGSMIWTAAGGLLILTGAALAIGLLTALASLGVGFAAMGAALSWLPAPTPNLFDAPVPDALIIVVAAAIALMGPGAWSVDARRFGLREIVIPRAPLPQKR